MLEQDEFLSRYKVKEAFRHSGLKWETLEEIYTDYEQYKKDKLSTVCKELQSFLVENIDAPYNSIRCRLKNSDHLIEKIIRKRGIEFSNKYRDISVENYREIIRDLIGVRILVLAKEDWEGIFDALTSCFPEDDQQQDIYMKENPVAYTRYGDRNLFKDKLRTEHSNKGYRSQHYVVRFQQCYCEIQVRTLSEEVYGEFDHKVKYPYREHNKFLKRYTNTLSQMLDGVDELISTCFQMGEDGWKANDAYYDDDEYIDWKHISQNPNEKKKEKKSAAVAEKTSVRNYLLNKISRKDKQNECSC